MDRKKTIKDRLNDVEESLDNIARSGLAQGCSFGLLAHEFNDVSCRKPYRERHPWRNTKDSTSVQLDHRAWSGDWKWSQLHKWMDASIIQLVFGIRKVGIE
ncbi:uncharacterized protein PITG_04779 [Phytophthora infestans T30-4]|uniref:Uncharacterized protein n=1 Tax=Phytophthora infestans (strain T30-4) TaxID=403677 RepID=D0N211_PHYIT|nr:uncharacterized protein PITG_04779 [Phytophthora infestans T30-4]EEY68340.1 hypothetical protein PITG_04779 [Phytophthora infestans T30-4]|eukprot:XP_002905499.1 hypothetical protein PITG_04779 [Phytophthora infestans T30-4]